MAYYIFLKSSRSLEEFRKNPHVKISPKSPCTNFQSLCKFKNLILYSERNFFHLPPQSAQPPHRPAWPLGPLGPTSLSSFSCTEAGDATAVGLAPPWLHPAMDALPWARHRIPRSFPLDPPSIHRVKRQLRASRFIPINASHSSTLTTGRPPLARIKREEPHHPPPCLPLLSFPVTPTFCK
jgi:hypothetical protein